MYTYIYTSVYKYNTYYTHRLVKIIMRTASTVFYRVDDQFYLLSCKYSHIYLNLFAFVVDCVLHSFTILLLFTEP